MLRVLGTFVKTLELVETEKVTELLSVMDIDFNVRLHLVLDLEETFQELHLTLFELDYFGCLLEYRLVQLYSLFL